MSSCGVLWWAFVSSMAQLASGASLAPGWEDLGAGCCPQIEDFQVDHVDGVSVEVCKERCEFFGNKKCGFITYDSANSTCDIFEPQLACTKPLGVIPEQCRTNIHSFKFDPHLCDCDGSTCSERVDECYEELRHSDSTDANASPTASCTEFVIARCSDCKMCLTAKAATEKKFDALADPMSLATNHGTYVITTVVLGAVAAAVLAASVAFVQIRARATTRSFYETPTETDARSASCPTEVAS